MANLYHAESNDSLSIGRRVHSAIKIQEVIVNTLINIILTDLSVVKKKLHNEADISCAPRSSTIFSADTDTMTTGICEFLNLMVDQTMPAHISWNGPKSLI